MDMNQFNVNAYNTDNVSPDWTYNNLTPARKAYVDNIVEHAKSHNIDATDPTFSRKQLKLISLSFKDNDDVPNWIVKDHDRRATLGVYFIPEVAEKVTGESPLGSLLKTNTMVIEDDNDDDISSVGDGEIYEMSEEEILSFASADDLYNDKF